MSFSWTLMLWPEVEKQLGRRWAAGSSSALRTCLLMLWPLISAGPCPPLPGARCCHWEFRAGAGANPMGCAQQRLQCDAPLSQFSTSYWHRHAKTSQGNSCNVGWKRRTIKEWDRRKKGWQNPNILLLSESSLASLGWLQLLDLFLSHSAKVPAMCWRCFRHNRTVIGTMAFAGELCLGHEWVKGWGWMGKVTAQEQGALAKIELYFYSLH